MKENTTMLETYNRHQQHNVLPYLSEHKITMYDILIYRLNQRLEYWLITWQEKPALVMKSCVDVLPGICDEFSVATDTLTTINILFYEILIL